MSRGLIADEGGITPSLGYHRSECCITGMFLNVACYFKTAEKQLTSLIDYLLSQVMKDGGFNCRHPKQKVHHSSLHTTICVCEGLWEYEKGEYTYRIDEVHKARLDAQEFILAHHLFKSDKTGDIIDPHFLSLHWPYHWHYDVLRALEYFGKTDTAYDQRMQDALDWLMSKGKNGIYPLSSPYQGKTFFIMEKASKSSKINTLRATQILQRFAQPMSVKVE